MNYENNLIETLISIFTIENGQIKVLLLKKKTDPYKGYWIIPGNVLYNTETLEDNIEAVLQEKIGLKDILIDQSYTFSNLNRYPKKRVLAVSYYGIANDAQVKYKMKENDMFEKAWFNIDELPKLGYDHGKILDKTILKLKNIILNQDTLNYIYPSDFTLPELQKLYEQVLNKKLDRRNFRKHIFSKGNIELTGDKSRGSSGRPASLYRFKTEESNKVYLN